MNTYPFVSIIIPVLNNAKGLERTLNGISLQSYPKDRFEVIVIDNGSTDNPRNIAMQFPNVNIIEENKHLNSPYSARNRGYEIAKGDVIVLLDTTCLPGDDWLMQGKAALDVYDVVGGDVVFDIDENSSIGEMYDAISNIRMKANVERKQVAKTTNLFIKRAVFESIGLFPEGLRSGGDVRWTAKAVKAGFRLGFASKARVLMVPRKMGELIKKQYRVAKGQPKIWRESGVFFPHFLKKVLLCWLPPSPNSLNAMIADARRPFLNKYKFRLFMMGWMLRMVTGIGNIIGIIKQK